MSERKVAIVGGGIAGAACAAHLRRAGVRVGVWEKSRGWGGRAATRREGALRFDHGAQYFTARHEAFRPEVSRWLASGTAARWEGRLAEIGPTGVSEKHDQPDRYVGVPGMSALATQLGHGLHLRTGTRIVALERLADGRWRLREESGTDSERYDAVVVAIPSAQAADLVDEASPSLAVACRAVRQLPCWAVMVAFDELIECEFDGAFVAGSSLSWIARDSSKPGREGLPDVWVLHASPEWSTERLEADSDDVTSSLLAAFFSCTGARPRRPTFLKAHLWRYARAAEPIHKNALLDPEAGLVVCGDWLAGDRIEGAYLSGQAGAGALLRAWDRDSGVGLK